VAEQQDPADAKQGLQVRNTIENVPKPDDQMFPPCLASVVTHLGRETTSFYLSATSGAAFSLVWHVGRWEGVHRETMLMTADPLDPFKRALASVGYDADFVFNGAWNWEDELIPPSVRDAYMADMMVTDKAIFRERIMASIDGGVPAIALGVVGEAFIIAGYDDSGDVLIGVEPTGRYFRRAGWFEDLVGIIVLGNSADVDIASTYRQTLEVIPRIVRTTEVHQSYTGQRAYEAYIEHMLDDSLFPADDMDKLGMERGNHYEAMTMLARRGAGAEFLRGVAAHPAFGAAKQQLLDAAEAFQQVNYRMGAWWKVVGPIWNDGDEVQIRATADPDMRRKFVIHIRAAQRKELEGVEHIERALAELH